MKKVIIDGKEYFQHEQSDIDKLPKMEIDKDILKKYKTECEFILRYINSKLIKNMSYELNCLYNEKNNYKV